VLDTALRARLGPALDATAHRAASLGLGAGALTGAGLAVGVGACVAAALEHWWLALGLWLANRTLDGLDGAVARLRGPTDLGGFLDFLADFVVYGGFVLAVAIAVPDARVACAALLAAYLLNNVALLSFAALVEKRRLAFGDERSLRFTSGLAEGTETIVAYTVICLIPEHAGTVAWVFCAMVLVTVAQRVAMARRALGPPPPR
jgi:phosphatidylglycerophosphate synthase